MIYCKKPFVIYFVYQFIFNLKFFFSVPMPLPQIIIEDPEGEVQCSECCKKSGEIKKLKEKIEEVKT